MLMAQKVQQHPEATASCICLLLAVSSPNEVHGCFDVSRLREVVQHNDVLNAMRLQQRGKVPGKRVKRVAAEKEDVLVLVQAADCKRISTSTRWIQHDGVKAHALMCC